MTSTERQAWLVVGSLFVALFLVFGSGCNTRSRSRGRAIPERVEERPDALVVDAEVADAV